MTQVFRRSGGRPTGWAGSMTAAPRPATSSAAATASSPRPSWSGYHSAPGQWPAGAGPAAPARQRRRAGQGGDRRRPWSACSPWRLLTGWSTWRPTPPVTVGIPRPAAQRDLGESAPGRRRAPPRPRRPGPCLSGPGRGSGWLCPAGWDRWRRRRWPRSRAGSRDVRDLVGGALPGRVRQEQRVGDGREPV